MVGQRSGPALLSEHSTSYPTVHAAPTPVAAPERSTVLKSPRRGWGSGRPTYCGGGAELHNNDPAPRWRLVLPSNRVNITRRRHRRGRVRIRRQFLRRSFCHPCGKLTAARNAVVSVTDRRGRPPTRRDRLRPFAARASGLGTGHSIKPDILAEFRGLASTRRWA